MNFENLGLRPAAQSVGVSSGITEEPRVDEVMDTMETEQLTPEEILQRVLQKMSRLKDDISALSEQFAASEEWEKKIQQRMDTIQNDFIAYEERDRKIQQRLETIRDQIERRSSISKDSTYF
jgi:uncharacterized protein (DUF885 family)